MKIDILTLFPEFFHPIFTQSILRRAIDANLLEIEIHDLKSYADGTHHLVDDYLYGGGAGMLLKPEPFFKCMTAVLTNAPRRPMVIAPSPQGKLFHQEDADELSSEKHLVFLCGHYKGIDRRVTERFVNREYSLGDYIVTGGEVAACVMIDAAVRLIPGVIGDLDSAYSDSFRGDKLDCFHYTRPEELDGMRVPEVLLSGHHNNIESWRDSVASALAKERRPDLMKKLKG
ncbi:tRNA (guanosine(37)-N1)-methyltransferase TrmD [Calditrichota bacterium]